QRAMSVTADVSPYGRTNAPGPYSVWRPFAGQPSAEILHWYPEFAAGSFTGTSQGGFTVEGNDDYLVIGGEFPTVNGTSQQGLVRFTTTANAPNTDRPSGYQFLKPEIEDLGPGTVRLGWTAAFDRDNELITYEILRGETEATSVVLDTFDRENSAWWARTLMGFTDDTADPGSTQTYRIRVTDPFGNGYAGPSTTVTIPNGTPVESIYRDAVQADRPLHHWRLGDAAGGTAHDWSASDDLILHSSVDPDSGAIVGDPDGSSDFDSTSNTSVVMARPSDSQLGPQEFSVEAWVRTTTTQGGKIIGYGNSSTSRSSSTLSDRNLYMTNNGEFRFGVRPDYDDRLAISSASGYNDGDWHHVVGTLDPDEGLKLYVDGDLVDSDATITSAQVFLGYWRIGGDRLSNWPGQPSRESINADLDEIAVYGEALGIDRIRAHRDAGLAAPVAGFTATVDDLDVDFDASSSFDNGNIVSYDWDFGDGETGTGVAPSHTYATYDTYTVTVTATDDDGLTGTFVDTVAVDAPNVAPTASFTTTVNSIDVDFDGTASADVDGTIVSHDWDFGDGETGTGEVLSHVYAAAGTYTVTLTVTDDEGATGVASDQVTTDAPPTDLYAFDDFDRIGVDGFGDAPTGGSWTHTGPVTAFSTDGAARVASAIGGARGAYLSTLDQVDTDLKATVALDTVPVGGDAYLSLLGRRVTATDDYGLKLRYRPDGSVIAYLQSRVGGATTTIGFSSLPGISLGADDAIQVRLQVSGTSTTTLNAKVWPAGTPEPEAWTLTASEPTPAALQAGGHVGTLLYVTGGWSAPAPVLTIDARTVRAPAEGPVPGAPPAPFTATAPGLAADADAAASADPGGAIVSWDWDFGDSTTGSGETVSHTYAAAGSYVPTLTVTDGEGNTAVASATIFVTDGTTTVPFGLDDFDRTVVGGLGDADLGGPWTTAGPATDFSVSAGAAHITSAVNAARAAYLTGAVSTDTDLRADVAFDVAPTGDAYLSIIGRRVSNGNDYRVKLRYQDSGQVTAYLVRTVGNASTVLDWGVVPGVSIAAGDTLSVRLEVSGTDTTDLALRVWESTDAEPVDALLTASEVTPAELQAPGHVGTLLYIAGNWVGPAPVMSIDHLSARPVGG
ncbi:MAG: PKD domain-containing protein, partial [Acidimicrobiales bacterium]|nr:PKD domain-containing protein [Acidimicrobiales bacterium]